MLSEIVLWTGISVLAVVFLALVMWACANIWREFDDQR
ncbi:Uncharacterised protein [Mycobacteroides abscessus subsp. bolletii]|nr:Uncharacterised protein [Mycobacteroides abscessus subsp. bolletii]